MTTDAGGSYALPQHAAQKLAGGHTFSLYGVEDSSELGVPEDLREWHVVPYAVQYG